MLPKNIMFRGKHRTRQDLADQLFEATRTDVVSFALPAVYARWVLPCPWAQPEPWPVKVLAAGGLGTIAWMCLRNLVAE